MTDTNKDLAIAQIISLMTSYSFDTDQRNPEELVQEWRKSYDVNWIHLATIEALYLGRYKAVSIEQILHSWLRLGQPNTHFGGDFERVISRKLPRHLSALDSNKKIVKQSEQIEPSSSIAKNSDRSDLSVSSPTSITSPKVTSTNTPLIPTKVTPVPQGKSIPTPSEKTSSSKKDDLTDKNSTKTQGIVTFQPIPDASGFFEKLKALARNQRKKES